MTPLPRWVAAGINQKSQLPPCLYSSIMHTSRLVTLCIIWEGVEISTGILCLKACSCLPATQSRPEGRASTGNPSIGPTILSVRSSQASCISMQAFKRPVKARPKGHRTPAAPRGNKPFPVSPATDQRAFYRPFKMAAQRALAGLVFALLTHAAFAADLLVLTRWDPPWWHMRLTTIFWQSTFLQEARPVRCSAPMTCEASNPLAACRDWTPTTCSDSTVNCATTYL